MCRALPCLLHGLITAWMRAALPTSTVDDADSPLNDVIFAGGVGTFVPDAIVFIRQGAMDPIAIVVSRVG